MIGYLAVISIPLTGSCNNDGGFDTSPDISIER